jgi:hypothetical protein
MMRAIFKHAMRFTTDSPMEFTTKCAMKSGGGIAIVLFLSGLELPAAPAWEQHAGFRSAPVSLSSEPNVGFAAVSPIPAGITFSNLLTNERSVTNRNLLSGAGLAAGDIDGDGWCDLYFCGLDSNNVLYRNLGNWRF